MGVDISQLSPAAQRQILDKLSALKKPAAKKRSKYGAVKTWRDGLCFDSRLEADYYGSLKLLHRAGVLAGFLHHNRIVLSAGTDQAHRAVCYEPDFVLLYPDGHYELVDTKGVETKEFKLKTKLLRERYPDVTVRLVDRADV